MLTSLERVNAEEAPVGQHFPEPEVETLAPSALPAPPEPPRTKMGWHR